MALYQLFLEPFRRRWTISNVNVVHAERCRCRRPRSGGSCLDSGALAHHAVFAIFTWTLGQQRSWSRIYAGVLPVGRMRAAFVRKSHSHQRQSPRLPNVPWTDRDRGSSVVVSVALPANNNTNTRSFISWGGWHFLPATFKNFHFQFINSCVSAFSVVRRGRPSVVGFVGPPACDRMFRTSCWSPVWTQLVIYTPGGSISGAAAEIPYFVFFKCSFCVKTKKKIKKFQF